MAEQRIAIIGSGISGLTCAYYLTKYGGIDVSVFESESEPGGHTHTRSVYDGYNELGIDMGFIVFNYTNYPVFSTLLEELNVDTQPSDMSFGYYHPGTGFYWNSDFPGGMFAHSRAKWSPSFYGMIVDILRFNKVASEEWSTMTEDETLAGYVQRHGFGKRFVEQYVVPTGAAIWSASFNDTLDFPAKHFLQFWYNHGLMKIKNRIQWRTVTGGSRRYRDAIESTLATPIKTNCPVQSITRFDDRVELSTPEGTHSFDQVIVACHADQAYQLLADPSDQEQRLLSVWEYSSNRVTLHTDQTVVAPDRKAWASWNYAELSQQDQPVRITYYMNRLQALEAQTDYFVSLNCDHVDPATILKEKVFTHPIYTRESMATQDRLSTLNGQRRTYFCGSYFGWGFHEDGARSGVEVCRQLGLAL